MSRSALRYIDERGVLNRKRSMVDTNVLGVKCALEGIPNEKLNPHEFSFLSSKPVHFHHFSKLISYS